MVDPPEVTVGTAGKVGIVVAETVGKRRMRGRAVPAIVRFFSLV